jgi:tetratricopeptide (TPR) repeat protein
MSASAVSTRALILYYARDYQAALDAIGHALQLEPGSASAYFMLSRIDAARGAINEALAANERALAIAGDNSSNSWRVHRLRLQALSGLRDEAKAGLVRIPAEAASRHQRVGFAQLASVHEALGDRVRALDLLEKAVSEREPDLLWLAVDPRVDSLRSEPRFEQVLARLGIPK